MHGAMTAPGEGTEIHIADGIFVKMMPLPRGGTWTDQHSHDFAHTTFIASGAVAAWENDNWRGVFIAPTGILIPANTSHRFLALYDDTVLLCIHREDRFEPKAETVVVDFAVDP